MPIRATRTRFLPANADWASMSVRSGVEIMHNQPSFFELVGTVGLKPAHPLQQDAVATFIPLCGLHKAIVII